MQRIESILEAYERRYDPKTGGWYPKPFDQENADASQLNYSSVEKEVGDLYYALVHLLRPGKIFETGTHVGYSTCKLAQGLRDTKATDGQIITVDPSRLSHLWEETDVNALIKWLPRYSQDVFETVSGMTFDLLVLDSDHTYDTCMREIVLFEPLLKEQGYLLFHDSLFFDGVGLAVKQLYDSDRFEVVTLDSPRHHFPPTARCPGISLCRKVRSGPPLVFDENCRGIEVGNADGKPFLRHYLGNQRRVVATPETWFPIPAKGLWKRKLKQRVIQAMEFLRGPAVGER